MSEILPDAQNPTRVRFMQQGPERLRLAMSMEVETQEQNDAAANEDRACRAAIETIEAFFKPYKRGLTDMLTKVREDEGALSRPYVEARTQIRAKMSLYLVAEQKRIRDAQAEADRIAREEAARKQAQDAERLDAMAEHTGDASYAAAAEQVRKDPPRPVSVAVPRPTKTRGVSAREEVSVRITDMSALVKAIGADLLLRHAIQTRAPKPIIAWLEAQTAKGLGSTDALLPNMVHLRNKAVQDGEAFTVPGVERNANMDVTVRR